MTMGSRNIRCEDDRWDAASERAKSEGTTLSKLIRQWLDDYIRGDEALAHRPARDSVQIVDELASLIDVLRAELGRKEVA
jgi:hypothetical protein